MIKYPEILEPIFKKLSNSNIRAIIVGGFVRDSLLGIASKDIDIELYGINSFDTIETLLEEFGSVNSVGKSFGVCKLKIETLEIDFSLPRLEQKSSYGHKGFLVTTQENLDFKTAASRRDFTINAIGFDVITKKILDPFNGIGDLNKSLLKCVNEKTFIEDPLRVLRAVQFSARFNLKLHMQLFLLCKRMIKENMLEELSHERIFDEILKLLLKSKKPSRGITLLKALNIQEYHFQEFSTLSLRNYIKTLNALDTMVNLKTNNQNRNISLMLCILTYHLPYERSLSFLTKLTPQKEILTKVLQLKEATIKEKTSNTYLYNLALKVNLQELLILHKALYPNKKNFYEKIEKRAQELNILEKKLSAILQGRDLINMGLKPSVAFKNILQKAYEEQMNEKFKTHKEALVWLKKELLA